MKERPILMSEPMALATWEDRKTQTRRIVKDPDFYGCLTGDCPHEHQSNCDSEMERACPYGRAGDRLFVRETFRLFDKVWTQESMETAVQFRAGMLAMANGRVVEAGAVHGKWTPSIHMPRWACRSMLEITEVRVERLQDISEDDAEAEGVEEWLGQPQVECDGQVLHYPDASFVRSYKTLWESINGPGSWAVNPWVWVIVFKHIKA